MDPQDMALMELRNIRKSYRMGQNELEVLHGISMRIAPREFVAMMGPSGSGKSTLMNILGCLDTPTGGEYLLEGTNVASLDRGALSAIRNSAKDRKSVV